ncbi:putative phage-associated protein [Sporosarcina sp. JAI121]|nr:putative phage-associated protein [Sporosarcina sp. JAI121]
MEFCPRRLSLWALDKAKKLIDSAFRNPFQKVMYHSHLINLQMYKEMLFQY